MLGILIEDGSAQIIPAGGGPEAFQEARVSGEAADSGQELDVLSLPPRGRQEHEEDVH